MTPPGPMSVLDLLISKHSTPLPPHSSTLTESTPLPMLEDIEITGAHINIVAHKIQGSAGPGGCNSSHWWDVLCHYSSNSCCLCDSVADLTRLLSNSLVEWPHFHVLLSNRLIALDKSSSVHPIKIGDTMPYNM